jgi:hypothetical protein
MHLWESAGMIKDPSSGVSKKKLVNLNSIKHQKSITPLLRLCPKCIDSAPLPPRNFGINFRNTPLNFQLYAPLMIIHNFENHLNEKNGIKKYSGFSKC